jgi:hypothetical protein
MRLELPGQTPDYISAGNTMRFISNTLVTVLAAFFMTISGVQTSNTRAPSPRPPAEDISGTYTFLHSGETLQINIEPDSVSGYVTRKGDLESDRGMMLSHFFTRSAVEGHDVSFSTKPVHGVRFEFAGRFERGPGKTKIADGYYVIRGELKEFMSDADGHAGVRTSQTEFKWMGQPE